LKREGPQLPDRVRVDPKMLNRVCKNLVDNAKKFSNASPELKLVTSRQGNRWSIEFRDSGLGFPPRESKRIFKRFYRAKHSAPYSISGTGLGLFLAKSACKRMRIRLDAESLGEGKGATFRLSGKSAGSST
jgi:signal transduction histidine kinase